ncbi:hypothetical protein [Frateuria sp. STR12]|uniref:hypothetical protein n=1 Tax=Frateuria hangzhouensis TaxID=2995589 RepID=UPI002260DB1B|nr:hypothetical protein [Frateuria sp. STR12]MCX7515166.1 hypothetical protein [Frateuria sp. STR12]
MANSNDNRGGSHEQHVKAGEQSHKNDNSKSASSSSGNRGSQGGSHEQHVKAGEQSHKND